MNYAVPNFGPDSEIENVHESIAGAEKTLNMKWIPKEVEAPGIVEYPTGRPLDVDMKTSLKNLGDTQS